MVNSMVEDGNGGAVGGGQSEGGGGQGGQEGGEEGEGGERTSSMHTVTLGSESASKVERSHDGQRRAALPPAEPTHPPGTPKGGLGLGEPLLKPSSTLTPGDGVVRSQHPNGKRRWPHMATLGAQRELNESSMRAQ